MSHLIVSGYNQLAGFVNSTASYIPKKGATTINGALNFLAEALPSDGLKTLVVKPLALAGSTLKFANKEGIYPTVARLGAEASRMKALISGLEVITKLPGLFTSLSTPVEGFERTRQYAKVDGTMRNGPKLTLVEEVSSRIFGVANWFIALGDAIGLVGNYRSLHAKLDKATPWIYTVAGGYMGVQSLYTEWKFAQGTWMDTTKETAPAEKYYGYLNLAASAAYIFSSGVGAAGLYFRNKAPSSLGYYQFAANVGIVLFPVAQKCAKQYMKVNVWS